jgi:hypothetical protein
MQIEQQGADRGAERRSRHHAFRRRGTEAATAGSTAPTEQFDAPHHRRNRRDVEIIVAMTTGLPLARDVGGTARTGRGQPLDRLVRHLSEEPCHTRARRPGLAPLFLFRLTSRLAVLRGWRVAIARGLLRSCQQRFQLGNPRRLPLDQRRLLRQQGILLAVTQAIAKWQNHLPLTHISPARATKNCQHGE